MDAVSIVGLVVAFIALGLSASLYLRLYLRRDTKARSSLLEQLTGMTAKEFAEFRRKPGDYGFHSLESILTEFKKALATSQQGSARHAKERPKIAYGERSTYAIQDLEVKLKGRIINIPDLYGATSDLHISFIGQSEEMSEIQFTVSNVPPRRTVSGASIFFALAPSQLTPDREFRIKPGEDLAVTLTACDENGNFLYNHRIDSTLYYCPGGADGSKADKRLGKTQQIFTNSRGRANIAFGELKDKGTYRIHAILWDKNGEKTLKADDYYFEAIRE